MAAAATADPHRVVVVSHLLPIHLEKSAQGWIARWDEEVADPVTAISRYTALGVRRLGCPYLFIGSPPLFIPLSERPAVEEASIEVGRRTVRSDPGKKRQETQGRQRQPGPQGVAGRS